MSMDVARTSSHIHIIFYDMYLSAYLYFSDFVAHLKFIVPYLGY